MTHQGSEESTAPATVDPAAEEFSASEEHHEPIVLSQTHASASKCEPITETDIRCSFCHRPCSKYIRTDVLAQAQRERRERRLRKARASPRMHV